jgi:hypothetical protein
MSVNPSIKVWLGKARPQSKRRRVELAAGKVQRFDGAGGCIRVLSGAAWITVNGQDFVLKSGHVLQMPPEHCPVVISGLKQTALVYEIRY